MANWKEPKNDYAPEDQVVPEIFNTLAENERYLQEKKITSEQVQDAEINVTQAASRVNLEDNGTVKGFFGKIKKWFADLRALAFKGTVATADIDNSAVTSAKLASSAVTSTKLGTGAVTTAKIADKAVTDAKINTVSASKVTGLHKVATSGDYNDLINKPGSGGGGGFEFKRYDFYLNEQPSDIDAGIYLCFVVFTNRASLSNVANLGLITCSPDCDNGSYSGISSIYDSGEEFKIQLNMGKDGKVGLLSSTTESECPTQSGYDGDGTFQVTLIKLSDLGTVGLEQESSGGGGTWKLLTSDAYQVYGDLSSKYATVYIPGLKKGDTVKFTALSVKLNEDYTNECYFFNAPDGNMVYGFTYDGWSYNELGEMTGWYHIQGDYDNPSMSELELSSESPYVGKVGLVDYGTANNITIKISCKQDNYLTVEWSDTAGFYVEMMPIYNIYVKR